MSEQSLIETDSNQHLFEQTKSLERKETPEYAPQLDATSDSTARTLTLAAGQIGAKELNILGKFYREKFQLNGELNDINKAIEYGIYAVDFTPEDQPDQAGYLNDIEVSYSDRFGHSGKIDDIRKAIEYGSRAVDLTPSGHLELSMRLNNLGLSNLARYQRLGDFDDLEAAIRHMSRGLDLAPDDHPHLPLWLSNLTVAYSNQFHCYGTLETLEKSIEYGTRSVELTPGGHEELPMRLSNLGLPYRARYQRLGNLDDLEKAINYMSRGLELTSNNHPYFPSRLSNLVVAYSDRFNCLGSLDDLERAIEYGARAVDLTQEGHAELPMRLNNLGLPYRARYMRLGDLDDLEKVIKYMSRALQLAPEGHPDSPLWLSNLVVAYSDRFNRLGTLQDLEKAIEYGTSAVHLTPDDHTDLPMRLINLGLPYRARYLRLGELDDLEKAIKYMSHGLELTPDGHPYLPSRLSNLVVTYFDRFNRLGTLNDLEKAIEYGTSSVGLTPAGHIDLPMRLSDLGMTYCARYLHTGGLDDLKTGVGHLSRTLMLTPSDHPSLSKTYFNLANGALSQYHGTDNPTFLRDALDYFRNASRLSSAPPRDNFQFALSWANLASIHSGLNCVEAYQTTIKLLPQFIWLGSTTNQRYLDLSIAGDLAINSATAALLHSDPDLALEWLEHARCVVWSQSLMLRSPLDQLHSSHPGIGSRLQVVAKKLQEVGSDLTGLRGISSDSDTPEQVGLERRQLAREYDSLLAQVRALPAFEDFLRPMKVKNLVRAAQNGPIVVINCHEHRCDALIIFPGREKIEHLYISEYNQQKARNTRSKLEASLRHRGLRQRGFKIWMPPEDKDCFASILLDLWTHVVKPVLDRLGFSKNIPTISLPHITWCPTGLMTFLPLHAAGDYNRPQSCIFDYVISSYTPTLTALLSQALTKRTRAPRVLAIGQANTRGHTPLPGTIKELDCLEAHAQNKVEYTQLSGSQATISTVLDAMEQHDWVHLACHAHQNAKDPTKSGFYLQDGTLDLASINQRSFKNKGLAFLSACQTATGDERLPDESIHLASGMLMAGYPSVIATMWSVVDNDASLVADKVYAQLMADGKLENGKAGRALHSAVGALRRKVGEKEFARWVPYIHIGS